MPRNPLADQVWRTMSALVIDNTDTRRRTAVDRTGLPFSRIRILRRLARRFHRFPALERIDRSVGRRRR